MINYANASWRKRWIRPGLLAGIVVAVGIIILIILVVLGNNAGQVPRNIKGKVSFVIQLPGDPWKVERSSFAYDQASHILTFHATHQQATLVLTEQATPSQFNDIPQYYPALLNKLNEYLSIGSTNGTGYLVKPTELKGQQELVLNNAGTLVFITPSSAISENDWRLLLNHLKLLN